MRVDLVRHGQSEWNVAGRLTGWTDAPLSELGRQQAHALREQLLHGTWDGVWSSDLVRAIDTARLALGVEPSTDPRLREFHFGILEGSPWADLPPETVDALKSFDSFAVEGGESADGFRARVHAFLDDLPDGRHIVFAHGGVLRVALRALGSPRFVRNCEVISVDWSSRLLLDPASGS